MLQIGQLAQIKSESTYIYEALTQIVSGVNAVGLATGVDPSGTIDPPETIGSLSVVAADGIFDLAITDNSAVRRGIFILRSQTPHPRSASPACISWAARATCVSRWAIRRSTGARIRNIWDRIPPRQSRSARLATAVSRRRREREWSGDADFCRERHSVGQRRRIRIWRGHTE